jgi:hypothetical protein
MRETNLTNIIEKVMGTVLRLEKLPYNPYNLMYRLMHHEAIYENLRRHYHQEHERNNFVGSNSPDLEEVDSNSGNEQDGRHSPMQTSSSRSNSGKRQSS